MEKLKSDNPILDDSQDTLERSNSARQFASNIFALDLSKGLVVGILGEWGSGKTSYINLMRNELSEHAIVLEFNPWMFSGVDNLVELFFLEMATQLKIHNNVDLSKKFKKYGRWLDKINAIPLLNGWPAAISALSQVISHVYSLHTKGISGFRSKLTDKLVHIEKPIVVILDDIDRLSSEEIQQIFKLVRLTGSFPNVVYLLALDRVRVEQALSEQTQINGAIYLEKILQVSFDIPKVSISQLQQNLLISLEEVLGNMPIQFDQARWGNVFYDVIMPNIKNMRDVNRYILTVYQVFKDINDSIQAVDVLAMEAIRLFLPKKFHEIYLLKDILTSSSDPMSNNDKQAQVISEFIEDNELYKKIVINIFPYAGKYLPSREYYDSGFSREWRKEKRLAEKIFLDFYFERFENKELSIHNQTERVWLVMDNEENFRTYLESIAPQNLQDILENLAEYEDDFTEDHTIASVPVIFQMIKKIPEKSQKSFFSFSPKRTVSRLVYRLIRSIPEASRLRVVQTLMENITLSGELEIIEIVGYHENRGHKLLTMPDVEILKEKLVEKISLASEAELANEYNILELVSILREKDTSFDTSLLHSKKIGLALLKAAKSEILSQNLSSYSVHQEDILFWDWLIKLYQSEDELHQMIDSLNADERFKDMPIMELARKYREGWRDRNYREYTDEE